jgi:spore germination cell wall hydrolase CwlJ-like protein
MALTDYVNPYIDQSGNALSPEAIAARRRYAYSMMQQAGDGSPTKANAIGALARALQGTMAGYMVGQTDKAEQQGISSQGQMLADMVSGGSSPSASPQASASPVQAAQPMGTPSAGKIYDANEPSPLDPPSGNARDLLIRTIYGEDKGPSALGVANVIRNRAVNGGFGGDTVPGVVLAKNQFEPWQAPQAKARMLALDTNSPDYARLGGVVDQAYAGNDPTNGATSFYSPTAQAALGRPTPQWAQGQGQDIGEHRFFGGAPAQPAQLAGPPPSPDSGQPPQPVPQGTGGPQGGIQKLISVVRDPTATPYQKLYATQMLQGVVQKQMSGGMKYIPQADGSVAWFNEFNPNQHGVITDPGMIARVGAMENAKGYGAAQRL